MKTTLIKGAVCFHCGCEMNAASGKGSPVPGDLIVCLKCGELSVFCHDLSLSHLTSSELRSVKADHALLSEMDKAIRIVRIMAEMNA
ncbi:MAG: hypothetical protein ACREBG_29980 [Pyrinomonadaceae bacterium]